MTSIAYNYRIGKNTMSKIIKETSASIWHVLSKEVFPTNFTPDYWKKISDEFQEKWQFPHCVGAIDGKHIVIQVCICKFNIYFTVYLPIILTCYYIQLNY